MFNLFALLTVLFFSKISANPPQDIPENMKSAFTINHEIPVDYWYFNNIYITPLEFNTDVLEKFIAKAKRRECDGYGETDIFLFQALDKVESDLKNKKVAVIGSTIPWYESILIAYGAHPVVIEYNPISSNDPRVTYLTVAQYEQNPEKFDYILSISSTEHDGLGRYGDPIDPNGDLKSMNTFKEMLNPGGKLFLAVPLGKDKLVWNAHRIYGKRRLKMLLEGWTALETYGFQPEKLLQDCGYDYQPIFVLTPEKKDALASSTRQVNVEEHVSLLIKIPTRGRFDEFFKALDAYYENLSGEETYCFVISCDEDDPVMNSQVAIEKLKSYSNLQYHFGKNSSKIEACNQDLDKYSNFDILLLGSDDMIPLVKGYDKIIVTHMKKYFPNYDGIVHFNEGAGPLVDPLPVMGKNYYNRFGYIYYPEYKSFYCDNEMTEVARMLNKYVYIDHLIIEHRSPGNYKRKMDELYARNGQAHLCIADEKLYKQRKAANYGLQIEAPLPVKGPVYTIQMLQDSYEISFNDVSGT